MIGSGEAQRGMGHGEIARRELLQGIGAGEIVEQNTVDMQQRPAIAQIGDDVAAPQLLE
jgi:hypothetical protein